MDSSRRKRRGGPPDDDRRRPARPLPAENDPRVTDDEVEEFFSILRRMRDATRSIAVATATATPAAALPRAPPPAEGPRWNPTFVLEDFMGPEAAVVDRAMGDRAGSAERPPEGAHAGSRRRRERLDLNEDPEQEGMGGTSPRGEGTARCVKEPG